MTKPRGISFKPSVIDQTLIDKLMEKGEFKTQSDLLRNAIMQLALVSLDPDDYKNAVAEAYAKDVTGQ